MSQSDFVSRGQALVAAGQFQEAVKVCRLGLLGRPTTVEGRVVLGQALLALKRYDEVLAEMRIALELDHTSFAAQILKGEALLKKGDAHAAVEALQRARQLAPTDKRVAELLDQAEKASGKPSTSASHPAADFVSESLTKDYPNHNQGSPAANGEEDSGGGYTKPTSVATPSRRGSSERKAAVIPAQDDLDVGDRSGTVEVDPDLDGVEVGRAEDFDDLAAPPVAKKPGPGKIGGARGSVKSSRMVDEPTSMAKKSAKLKTPTAEIEDDDLLDAQETRLPEARVKRPSQSAVRNAVNRPSGPLDEPPPPRVALPSPLPPPGGRPKPPSVAPPAIPLPPAPGGFPSPSISAAGVPSGPLAAALPTMIAPGQPPGISPQSLAAAARPTMTPFAAPVPPPEPMSSAAQQSAAVVDQLFEAEQPGWARATVLAGGDQRSVPAAFEPTMRPNPVDPAIQQLFDAQDPSKVGIPEATPPPQKPKELRTGMRKTRSRLAMVLWIVAGALVIGGGVFAGFQIRKYRLDAKIVEAREHATDLAKADMWRGWTLARDGLAGIVQASPTLGNRAALARARALIAFEFGDGIAEAKAAVDDLAGRGGLDGDLAAAFLSLASSDVKASKVAADAALARSPKDAASLYVAGQAALLAGDPKAAIASLRAAVDREPRPLYSIALARALGATYAFDDALAILDGVLKANPDHPSAVIARGTLIARSGRIGPRSPLGEEVRAQLAKVVAEGTKAPGEQPHGVSPAQVAFADLALAQLDFSLGNVNNARSDVLAASTINLDDQRFAEEVIDTFVTFGPSELDRAQRYADKAAAAYPASRRVRIARAQLAIARGKPSEAIDLLDKELVEMAGPRTIRGDAYLAMGDLEAARADYKAALDKLPAFQPAQLGLAWAAIAAGDLDGAKKLVAYKDGASPGVTTAYAAILRASGDREGAKKLLEKLVATASGPDLGRADLELARVYRDLGDFRAARARYEEAAHAGDYDARVESAELSIEDLDPEGGRAALDALLKDAGDHPTTALLLETARARMLVGDHMGAQALLEQAAKAPGTLGWKLDRERGRLALRKEDFAAAAKLFERALDGCGADPETFLLAADAATAVDAPPALIEKIKKLSAERLKGTAEAAIVSGKLLIAANKNDEADVQYQNAKKLLENDKASRRLAQVHLGLAVVAYYRQDDPNARQELEIAMRMDPSLYNAFQYAAATDKKPAKALEYAERAVQLDPDGITGWSTLGQIAAQLHDKKKLADAIGKLESLAPQSSELAELQKLRR